MAAFDSGLSLYAAVIAAIWGLYLFLSRRREIHSLSLKTASEAAGLTEPLSMHPAIDPLVCVGCGTCARACPEGDVLGLIAGRAELVSPTKCIGHGECSRACPTGAISLVFGTARRGVELPQVGADFQTNVPGLYIAGELGGMGLIRNAVEQGRQAIDAIAKKRRPAKSDVFDVVIVGAGPAGIAAALAAKSHGLRYTVVEQDDLGGSVFKYPRGKVVMTSPVVLPIVGSVKLRETTKEALLSLWREIAEGQELVIRYRERVELIESAAEGFAVATSKGKHRSGAVLLAIGRRGTPRRLDVPGEDLPHVVYQMIDAEQYRGRRVLVVGGGDSALEAVLRLSEQPGTQVTLSYRAGHFARARVVNRERVQQLASERKLNLLMPSQVLGISPGTVELDAGGSRLNLPADNVIICAGGILPADFLKRAGVAMEMKHGTA